MKLLITLDHMVLFDQIMNHSARNDKFPIHTFLLATETDYSTFTAGCANYCQLIPNRIN